MHKQKAEKPPFCFTSFCAEKNLLQILKQTGWPKFHQHYTSSFFVQKLWSFFLYLLVGWYFFGKMKLAEKLLVKCWWNWLLQVLCQRYILAHSCQMLLNHINKLPTQNLVCYVAKHVGEIDRRPRRNPWTATRRRLRRMAIDSWRKDVSVKRSKGCRTTPSTHTPSRCTAVSNSKRMK